MTAIYARQSIDKKDSVSVDGQIDLCKRECGQDEISVYQDKGFSGKNTRRPSFEKMLAAVREDQIQKIVVYRLDRFSRSIADFGRIWELLREHNVEFVSVNEKFDTTLPMGRAMLHIIMVFAQLERETIAERVRDNYQQRANRGEWAGGSPPFGFDIGRIVEESGKKSPILIPNAHVNIVNRIFIEYALPEASLGSLAKALTKESVPCMKRPAWDSTAISRVLHNPAYVRADKSVRAYFEARGICDLPSEEGFDGLHACLITKRRERESARYTKPEEQRVILLNHMGVIPAPLWLQCQEKLDRNRQLKNSGKGKHSWLSGLLKCGRCGYSVKINLYKNRRVLICAGRTNYRICSQKFELSLDELEAAVSMEIKALFAGCAARRSDEPNRRLHRELTALDEKIGRLISALADGNDVSMNYINRELQRLDRQKQSLIKQLEQPPKAEPRSQFSGLEFDRLEFEEKKLVAAKVIDKILLGTVGSEILWKL